MSDVFHHEEPDGRVVGADGGRDDLTLFLGLDRVSVHSLTAEAARKLGWFIARWLLRRWWRGLRG